MRDWIEEEDEDDYVEDENDNDELEEGEISKLDKLNSYFDVINTCGV